MSRRQNRVRTHISEITTVQASTDAPKAVSTGPYNVGGLACVPVGTLVFNTSGRQC